MELKDYRAKLDAIDHKLLALFLERMDTAAAIADYKNKHGLPILVPGREREILDRVKAQSGELAPYAASLFETLLYLSREYQASHMGD